MISQPAVFVLPFEYIHFFNNRTDIKVNVMKIVSVNKYCGPFETERAECRKKGQLQELQNMN